MHGIATINLMRVILMKKMNQKMNNKKTTKRIKNKKFKFKKSKNTLDTQSHQYNEDIIVLPSFININTTGSVTPLTGVSTKNKQKTPTPPLKKSIFSTFNAGLINSTPCRNLVTFWRIRYNYLICKGLLIAKSFIFKAMRCFGVIFYKTINKLWH